MIITNEEQVTNYELRITNNLITNNHKRLMTNDLKIKNE